jgi:hypothetical protein
MLRTTRALAALSLAGALLCAAAGTADARSAGFSPQDTCTGFTGKITYAPGLGKKPHAQDVTINGTLTGCTNNASGTPQPGDGTFFAHLTGSSSCSAVALSGTFTINWPSSSGLNPTVGTVQVHGPNSDTSYGLQGSTSQTQGAWEGSALSSAYVATAHNPGGTCKNAQHKVKWQKFTNTQPLVISHNFG